MIESFAGLPDGAAPDTTPEGWPVTNFPASGAGQPWIKNGTLRPKDPNTVVGGTYRIVEAPGNVRGVGCRYTIQNNGAAGGVFAVSIQDGNYALTSPGVPRCPVHFYHDDVGWSLDINQVHGTPVDGFLTGKFLRPMRAEGVTLHTLSITIERAAQEVCLSLPDGTQQTFWHPVFDMPSRFVYIEPFKSAGTNQAAKMNTVIRDWWIDCD